MLDDNLDDELGFHLETEILERMQSGMTRAEAETAARRDFGSLALVKEVTREMWGWRSLERLAEDVRYAFRLVRRYPGFTLAVVLSVALGVGAQTAVFSVVNAVLLRPLAFPDAGRLVAIAEHTGGADSARISASGPDFTDFHDQSVSFEHFAGYLSFTFPLTDTDEPAIVACTGVSPEFFQALGVQPLLGRAFRLDEFKVDGGQVLIGYGFWQRRFGGDPRAIGKTIYLNHSPHEIIGIMPPMPDLFDNTEIYAKYAPIYEWARQRDNRFIGMFGRLRRGVTPPAAREELQAIYRRMPGVRSNAYVEVTALKEQVVGGMRSPLIVLLVAVGMVLLIACANVANLLLARGAARRQEIATRFALGASRYRMIRQFVTESLVLSLLGGVLGLFLALFLVRLLLAVNPAYLPRANGVQVDLPVLLFTLAVSLLSGLVFSVGPVAAASRVELYGYVKSRGTTAGREWTRGALVACELALAVILLTGAGLLARSFWLVLNVSPGYRPDHVLTLRLRVPDDRFGAGFYPAVLDRLSQRPGIQAAAVSDCVPNGFVPGADLLPEGRALNQARLPTADACFIGGDYFQALGIPLLAGRDFQKSDSASAPPVVIVSQSVAAQLWPEQNPIAKRLAVNYRSLGRPTETAPLTRTVVGVVADIRQRGLEFSSRMAVYLPYEQDATRRSLRAMMLFARAAADPESMARSVQVDVRATGPDVPVQLVSTLEASIRRSLAPRVFSLVLLGCFAVLALLLAAAGIYGVVSYAVARRVREIGIRMALGAGKSDVLRAVFGQEARWLATGLVSGLLGSLAAARFLRGMLFGVQAGDVWTLAAVVVTLTIVSVVACWVPAVRATRVDPMIALRVE